MLGALALAVALLAVLVAITTSMLRVQRRAGRPYLHVRSGWHLDVTGVCDVPADCGAWVTCILDRGAHPMTLSDVRYDLAWKGEEGSSLVGVSAVVVIDALRRRGYRCDVDYAFMNLVPGAFLGPADSEQIAALPMPLAREFLRFAVHYRWRGVCGEVEKTVFLVPPLDPPDPRRPMLPDPVARATLTR